MEYEIKRINAWSIIKIVFLVSFLLGALIGIFYALILTIFNNLISNIDFGYDLQPLGVISLFFLIIFFAIFISITNSIISVIFVGSYNFLASCIGGIKLDVKLHNDVEEEILE